MLLIVSVIAAILVLSVLLPGLYDYMDRQDPVRGRRWRYAALGLYLLACAYVTLLNRSAFEQPQFNLTPFWSWRACVRLDPYPMVTNFRLFRFNILNILMLVPLGYLLPLTYWRIRGWQVILQGLVFSLVLEALQLLFSVGLFEIDDLIHNTLGCSLGLGIHHLWGKKIRY